MDKWECPCGYVYDPEEGDLETNIHPGTAWEDLPEDWVCQVDLAVAYMAAGREEEGRARDLEDHHPHGVGVDPVGLQGHPGDLLDLLLEGHPRDQVAGPQVHRPAGVEVGGRLLGRHRPAPEERHHRRQRRQQQHEQREDAARREETRREHVQELQ